MKVIILYGAPGVGKYTIGKRLAKKLKFLFVHNHTLINPVAEIFGTGNKSFVSVEKSFRTLVTKELVINKTSFVATYAFGVELGIGFKKNNQALKDLYKLITKNGGECIFVHLKCDLVEHKKRVSSEGRKKHSKLTNSLKLEGIIAATDADKQIDFVEHLEIDVTTMSAKGVVSKIINSLNEKRLSLVQNGNSSENCKSFGVFLGEINIGECQLRIIPKKSANLPEGFESHVYYEIKEEFRSNGYATKVLELLVNKAKVFHLKELILSVSASNLASIRVIEKNKGVLIKTGITTKGEDYLLYKINITL